VAGVSDPAETLRLYCVPTKPVNVQLATLTTPATAVRFEQFDKVPEGPPPDTSVTAADDEVTTLPPESSILMTGWVEKADPEAPATGWVVKINWVAAPGLDGEKLALVDERAPDVAVKVYDVPTTPTKLHVATVTTPAFGVRLVQSVMVPADAVKVIGEVDDVTTRPDESSMVTTGCVVNAEPEGPAMGWVVKTNCDATPVILKLLLVAERSAPLDAVKVSPDP